MPDLRLVEQELTALENEWMDAWRRRDRSTCEWILADDFVLTSALSTGQLTDRQHAVAAAFGPLECQSFHFDRINVRLYDDVAIVNALFQQQATAAGEPWNGAFLFTDVWVRRGNSWQVVTRHSSRPANQWGVTKGE